MGNRGINRRSFLKFSAGAMAAAMATPYLGRAWAQDATQAAVSQATGTLRFVTWDGEEELPIERSIVAEFNKQFPNITVSVNRFRRTMTTSCWQVWRRAALPMSGCGGTRPS